MMTNERDTHFQGFAKLLRDDITTLAVAHHEGKYGNPRDLDEYERLVHLLIAQRAYDLVKYTLLNVDHLDLDRLTTEEHTVRIPDLTQWPTTAA